MRSFLVSLALTLAFAPAAFSKNLGPIDLKGKSLEQYLVELIPGMGANDPPARYEPQQKWQAVCIQAGAPGREATRLEVCKLMTAKLGGDTPEQARVWLLKQLEFLGRAESVDTIAKVIGDRSEIVSESAVRALANNPADAAAAALAAKLPSASPKTKVALLNALGYRKAASAVGAIAAELPDGDRAVATSAARALGRIASPEAASHLAKAHASIKAPSRNWVADAYLACADEMLRSGKHPEAAKIYAVLAEKESSRSIRMAALAGGLRTAGDMAGDRVLTLLAGDDRDARNIALAEIPALTPKAHQSLVANADKLPAAEQALLLGVLTGRGDKSQTAFALKASRSDKEELQRAGILALGRVGDADVVGPLVELAFSNSKLAGPARESLTRLVGPGVDEKIIALLKAEKDSGKRSSFIGVLESRRSAIAQPALLEEAVGADAGIRQTAMRALGRITEPKDIGLLLPALLKAGKGSERENAERAIVAVVARVEEADKRAEPIVAVVTAENKADLLPLVGRLGGPKALALAHESLKSDSADIRSAAVAALCNWPDASVSPILLGLVNESVDDNQKRLAFVNVVRVNSLSNEHPAPPRLANLKAAMTLTHTSADKKLVIDALATVKDIESLRMVLPYLDDKELVQPACKTIVELAHSKNLRQPNQEEFVRALDRVLTLCRDAGLIERAKKYKAGG
jgi:HEAT repeat protein